MKVLMIGGDQGALDPATPTGKRTEEYRKIAGELEVLLCYGNLLRFTAAFFKGLKLMRKKKFDLITAQAPEHWLIAWALSRFFKTPWQMQIHTDIFSPYFWRESLKNKIRVLIAKFLLPRAGGIRVVSERIKNSLLALYPKPYTLNPISVLPIFVNTEEIRNAPIKTDLHKKYPNHDFIILMASRLTREKNIDLALGAVKEIIERNPPHPKPYTLNPMLLIVGEGPERKNLESRIKNYRLADNVKIENWTNDLASYYKTADLFLLTSNYEGYGRTPIEALAAGLPVVMTDVGVAGEVVKNGQNGLVVPVNDAAALAKAIEKIYNKSLQFEKAHFETASKEQYLSEYKKLWTDILNSKNFP